MPILTHRGIRIEIQEGNACYFAHFNGYPDSDSNIESLKCTLRRHVDAWIDKTPCDDSEWIQRIRDADTIEMARRVYYQLKL